MRKNPVSRILEEGYSFKITEYIGTGIEIFQNKVGSFIWYSIVAFFIYFAVSMVTFGSIIIQGPLIAEFTIMAFVYHQWGRSYDSVIYASFTKFWPLLLASLYQTLILWACFAPIMYLQFHRSLHSWQDAYTVITYVYRFSIIETLLSFRLTDAHAIAVLVGCVPAAYLLVSWMFTYHYIWFYNMPAWEAMESSRKVVEKKWPQVFLFALTLCVVAVSGFIFFFVGIFGSVPLVFCMLYAAFADIHGLDVEDENEEVDYSKHLIE